ncbi:hypothetical protein BSLG_005648 [Batrachochytrium salamandrivorans]|nr:hypothetical protein BSLG_005648 [Batrachochytrium salamandrivorans]
MHSIVFSRRLPPSPNLSFPSPTAPSSSDFAIGILKAGIGQLPLTLLNSVIAVSKLADDLYPNKAKPVAPVSSIAIFVGVMNLTGGWFGSTPYCHGSGGLAAQYRFGARTGTSVILLASCARDLHNLSDPAEYQDNYIILIVTVGGILGLLLNRTNVYRYSILFITEIKTNDCKVIILRDTTHVSKILRFFNGIAYGPSVTLADGTKWIIGICALDTKARSKPMRNILNRIIAHGDFEAVVFQDKVILDEARRLPMYSDTTFCINNLPMQELLLDRRLVLSVLDAISVPTPRRIMGYQNDLPQMRPDIETHLATLVLIWMNLAENPISGEDHNVYIYYDAKSGGGVRKLFQFMSVDNAEDVKVYTIGSKYAHAETRKSPVVDGVVRRNAEGKEVRYITPLSDEEKEIAAKVSKVFGPNCMRFDLLRAGSRSYVIDVNGCLRSKAKLLQLLKGSLEEVVLKRLINFLRLLIVFVVVLMKMEDQASLQQLIRILDAKATMIGTKVQLKPGFSKSDGSLEKIQLIVKWGGVFTHGGLHQSRDLGENLRKDLLIINKSLLDHEMLDDSNAAKEQMDKVKSRLQRILNPENPEQVPPEFIMPLSGTNDMASLVHNIVELLAVMRETMHKNTTNGNMEKLQAERWEKLFHDFIDVEQAQFEPSKISELYDSLKYDLIHNRDFLQGVFASSTQDSLVRKLYNLSKELFDIIGPHEYGIDNKEKLEIGFQNASYLLKHLLSDLDTARASPSIHLFVLYQGEQDYLSIEHCFVVWSQN